MYKKYIFIVTALVLSGCQQTSVSLGNYTIDSASFTSYSTCETKTLKNKEFNSLWHRMRSGFCFNNVNSSRISQELKWMKKNKQFVYRSIERSKPYLFHILNYLEQKNLPHELALLPMVESGFQPFAYSASRAAGIWQFIPPTAREYGLKMNWHYDGRRDVLESTKAATYFLSDMHRHFKGNWLLAIASYNTGAGNVGKAIDRANNIFTKPSYWDLDLPRETELYVPRLLALAKIVNNPSKYGFKSANMKNPIFRDILKKSQEIISGWGGKMYFVYLPDFATYSTGSEHLYRNFVIQTATDLNIPIIDIHSEIFEPHPDPLSFFPLRVAGHYNKKGYKLISELISKRLKKDGYITIKSKK